MVPIREKAGKYKSSRSGATRARGASIDPEESKGKRVQIAQDAGESPDKMGRNAGEFHGESRCINKVEKKGKKAGGERGERALSKKNGERASGASAGLDLRRRGLTKAEYKRNRFCLIAGRFSGSTD